MVESEMPIWSNTLEVSFNAPLGVITSLCVRDGWPCEYSLFMRGDENCSNI
eukprot:JP438663.1.p2 GENE.JP438663.1~~JP438663.1.p2  ORF type:complete len:51 (+),score=0.42 JP438663.1:200-352(+)